MPSYELLAEDDKSNRRTIMDALEVLRAKANFEQDDVAKIQLGRLKLPSSQLVSLILISFESTIHQKIFLVSLPTANRFRAKSENYPASQEYEIAMLGGATINSQGQVQLSNGARIRAVEVIPALLPYHITALDWAIIRQTVAVLHIEDRCRYHPVTSY